MGVEAFCGSCDTSPMSKRTQMLGSVVREIVAPALKTCPPECGIVTITTVDISSDSSYATVYVTAFKEPEKALEHLQEQRHELQRRMGKMERARIPLLRFRIDHSADEGNRIDELLGKLSKEKPEDTSDGSQGQRD